MYIAIDVEDLMRLRRALIVIKFICWLISIFFSAYILFNYKLNNEVELKHICLMSIGIAGLMTLYL